MNKQFVTLVMLGIVAAGCSGGFWSGGAAGAGAGVVGAGAGYELRARQQMAQLREDLDAGRISQHDYDVRKDQIQQGSIFY